MFRLEPIIALCDNFRLMCRHIIRLFACPQLDYVHFLQLVNRVARHSGVSFIGVQQIELKVCQPESVN